MLRNEIEQKVVDLINFRSNMKVDLTYNKARSIWGKRVIENLSPDVKKKLNRSRKGEISQIALDKISIVRENLDFFKVFNWVKFIGISGSVAAGFAKEEDDIDIYIVVNNYTAWIYRGILTIKNLFNHKMRAKRDGENVKDLFCVNFIAEERGLQINDDIFNFHELMYLIPIGKASEKYLPHIYSQNSWLNINDKNNKPRSNSFVHTTFIIRFINWGAYVAQIIFMVLARHSPEIDVLRDRYKKGRIEFFPSDFKRKVLEKI